MSTPDESDWDLEPVYGRTGAPWVRRVFGPLLGFDVNEADRRGPEEHSDAGALDGE